MRYSGVIEGFYGPAWSVSARLAYPAFLKAIACNTYIYAPKSDAYLRNLWYSAWPKDQFHELQMLAERCATEAIQFGIGLSPLGVVGDFTLQRQAQLQARLAQISALNIDVLCVLFDDMPGDNAQLAAYQLDICRFIENLLPDISLIMCPSYYSYDPVLERVFGARPANYWRDLGAGLSDRWSCFWTGDLVVSSSYSAGSLASISSLLKRKPVIWDNYPVNDGKKLCPFLNFEARDHRAIAGAVDGILQNPMNQAACSQFTLARMQQLSEIEVVALLKIPPILQTYLSRDAHNFQFAGLDAMTDLQRAQLARQYGAIEHPIAREIEAWLAGEYAFDPACLT